MNQDLKTTENAVQEIISSLGALKKEIRKVIIGQEETIDQLLITFLACGHALLEGVPGLAKTLMIRTLSDAIDLRFRRIQFTPDLMPSDIIGTEILEEDHTTGKRVFRFNKGPLFANIILADEINRTSPKTQSALLEAMQEKTVTIGETTFKLDRPFLVMATQNPVDQEGTYPLPEAQIDRFMLKVFVDYPTKDQELEIMRRISNMQFNFTVNPLLTKEDIFAIREEVNKVKISESLERYIIEIVSASRKPKEYGLDKVATYVQFGASPRASINMNLAAKAAAYMEGRDFVLPEDIKEIARDVMNHRILLNYEAEADNVKTIDIIEAILSKIPISK